MGEVVVRRARSEDIPAVLELLEEMERGARDWRVFRSRPGFDLEIAERYRRQLGEPDVLHVVANEDGRVVGSAVARIATVSSASDEPAAELSGVVVRPSHRERGIGRALTTEAVRFARERGVRIVVLRVFAANEGGVRFWQRLGFRPRILQMTAETASFDLDRPEALGGD